MARRIGKYATHRSTRCVIDIRSGPGGLANSEVVLLMTTSYDYRLVALSVLIAIGAAYTALDLVRRTAASRGRERVVWLGGGAAAMGLGIWSMHYIGMLAFELPVPVLYDLPTVFASFLAAVFASAVALFVVSRKNLGVPSAVAGSVIMGGGIAAMHYTGMAAMRLPATCHWNLSIVALSVVIAIVASFAALWIAFHFRSADREFTPLKAASALVMGFAMAGMHYTGMAAAGYAPGPLIGSTSHAVSVSSLGAAGISTVTAMVLALAVLTSIAGRQDPAARRLVRPLVFVFLGVMGGMAAYEALQMLAFPHISIWASHLMTIGVSSVVAVFVAYLLIQQHSRLLARAVAELQSREQAEQALRESEEKFRLLFADNPLPVWVYDLESFCFLEVNDAAVRHYGYTRAQFLSMTIADIRPPEDVVKLRKPKEASQAGTYSAGEWRHRKKDGSLIEVQVVARPLRFAGRPAEMILAIDLTERKRAERELAEERNLFETLMDCIPDTIYFQDFECRFMKINKAQARLLGIADPKDAIGKTDFDFFPPEFAQACYDAEKKLLESGKPIIDAEQKLTRPNGQVQWLSTTEVPFRNVEGKVIGYVGVSRDITERKLVEIELARAKEAAESANRTKSQFLANMSHEIRTPMNGILGMTELALDTELTSEQKEYLETVKLSADSLLTIINDVLDFSKVDAGKFSLESIDFNLRDCLEVASRSLAPSAHRKGLELILEIRPGVPEEVHGDPTRVRQVVLNLVGNAIKFTEHGEVVLGVEEEASDAQWTSLHFWVKDTGIGVPPEKQQAIFEAFAQADTSMTRRYGGTGLGLTISAALVEMMQGRIWVESEVGNGSRFHFTVLLATASLPASTPHDAKPALPEGIHALVVDDNATNRRLLETLLTRWKMETESVDGAENALEAMRRAYAVGCPFQVVLTDAHMPGIDGFTLAARIKHDPELCPAVIMMLSSGGQRGDAVRCRELGVAAYLTKPVRQRDLRDAISQVLDAHGYAKRSPDLVTRHSLRESRRSLHILLVEDNAVNLRLAVRLLEKQGYTVVAATDGRKALAILEHANFDLAIVDVQMPEMDGFELTRAIRARERLTGNHLPIVAMTAHAMIGDRERCAAAGMDAYLSKPIDAGELLNTVESICCGESLAPAATP